MTYGAKVLGDWLEDADGGLAAVLAAIPLGAETIPATPGIANELDDGWVARGEAPREILEEGDWIAVYQEGEANYPGTPQSASNTVGWIEGTATYAIAYFTQASDTASGSLRSAHVMRALRGSIYLLMTEPNGAAREKYGFRLGSLTGIRVSALSEERGDSLLTAVLYADFAILESAPISN